MIWFIIFCCWVVSFFFNGIESGLLSIDPVRLRKNVKNRVLAAMRLNRLLKRPERLLVTVLLVTNAADIIGLVLLTRQLVGV
jgi:Mg2+/Co2+ transporter CorB